MKYLIYLVLCVNILSSNSKIIVDSSSSSYTEYEIDYYIDKSEKISFDEIQTKKFETGLNKKSFNKNNPHIWFRIEIKNTSANLKNLSLVGKTSYRAYSIDFYEVNKDNALIKESKYDLFNDIGNKDLMVGDDSKFDFKVDAHDSKIIYIKNVNLGYHLVEFLVFDRKAYTNNLKKDSVYELLLIGFLISLVFYNFILYIVLRYKEYLYYSLYLFSAVAWMSYGYGLISQYFEVYDMKVIYLSLGIILIPFFLSLFVKTVFETRQKYKFEDWILNSLIFVALAQFIYALFDYYPAFAYSSSVAKYSVLVFFVVGISLYRKGDKLIKYFLMAHVFFVIFSSVAVLFYDGKIQYNYITSHSVAIGMFLEALFLSYLLAYRIKVLESAKNDLLDNLENKVEIRTTELNDINEKIQNSIKYALLIQNSILPRQDDYKLFFDDYLLIWKPKDIVSGDIHLFTTLRHDDEALLMIIDCTGHGVAGAFVTMIVKTIQKEIVTNILKNDEEVNTAFILEYFNKSMKILLKQENKSAISNAGFDGGIVYINKREKILRFSGAKNSLFVRKSDDIKIISGDRHSIGYVRSKAAYKFTQTTIDINDETFYMMTDGFADQLGGKKEFPFGKDRLLKSLKKIGDKTMSEQKDSLIESYDKYKGNYSQTDDTTLFAFKL